MAVDVSGMVQMLSQQPGQNIAQLGATIAAAQGSALKQKQQAFENQRKQAKDALEEKMKKQEMTINDLEIAAKRGEEGAKLSGKIAMAKDPLVRQQIFKESIPQFRAIGVNDQQLAEMAANVNDESYWLSKTAQALSAKDVFELHQPKPAEAPTTRNYLDGTDRVYEEWRPDQMEWVEVGRGPARGEGPSINLSIGDENKLWASVHDRYEKDLKNVREEREKIGKLKTAINTGGGASAQALQTSIADLFGGQTRAVAELERWASFGNLPERVVNSATRFIMGEYSEGAKADVLRLLRNYESDFLNQQHEEINERYAKVAEQAKVPLDFFMREVPEVRNLDFANMDIEDIKGIDLNTLELDEREALDERLQELGY